MKSEECFYGLNKQQQQMSSIHSPKPINFPIYTEKTIRNKFTVWKSAFSFCSIHFVKPELWTETFTRTMQWVSVILKKCMLKKHLYTQKFQLITLYTIVFIFPLIQIALNEIWELKNAILRNLRCDKIIQF